MRRLLTFVITTLAFGVAAGCGQADVTAQDTTGADAPESTVATEADPTSVADQFVGTYKLVTVERRVNDGDWEAVVPERLAYIIYDTSGHMSVQLMPVDRQPYAGQQPTAEEALATIANYGAYHGPYSVDESTQTVTHHRAGHLNPGQTGVDATRGYEFSGNQLTLTPPSRIVDGEEITTHLIWERLPKATLTAGQEPFVGFWRLVSNERHTTDGGELVSSVEGQTGYIMYTASGHMAVQMMRPDRQPYAGGEPTAEEALAALTTYSNYFGTFSVNEEEGFGTHHREGNLNPSGMTDAKRFRTFSGDRLILKPPVSTVDGQKIQSTITWERITGPSPTE